MSFFWQQIDNELHHFYINFTSFWASRHFFCLIIFELLKNKRERLSTRKYSRLGEIWSRHRRIVAPRRSIHSLLGLLALGGFARQKRYSIVFDFSTPAGIRCLISNLDFVKNEKGYPKVSFRFWRRRRDFELKCSATFRPFSSLGLLRTARISHSEILRSSSSWSLSAK